MKHYLFILCVACAALLSACGSTSYSTNTVRTPRFRDGGGSDKDKALAKIKFSIDEQRVVIYNARLTMKVHQADTFNIQLAKLAQQYEGYVVSLGSTSSVIRVKAEHLGAALEALKGKGKMEKKTISGEDVTEQYHDYEIRLDNLSKARARYLELLAKAENVEAALKVEKELERVNIDMESLKGKLESMKHLAAYSTISINLEQRHKTGILGYVFVGLYKGVKWLFVRS